jgi:HAE1 family hydrophobic/amphiphilic exporter-1
MGSEEMRQSAAINGKTCVAVRIVKKADANALEVVNNIRKELERMRNNLPGGIEIVWVSDMGNYIEASVSSAIDNIWQGILLTAALMFFFLYNLKSTLTVAITMPITVIAGIFFISLMGYTLNTVTLLALGLSIGILVTNSIVVLESIVAHLETSQDEKMAAIDGSRQVVAAVIASAGTNIVVLFPVSMMKGQIGQFFIPFALTMVGITAISLLISFTLTPAIAGQILKKNSRRFAFLEKAEAIWNRLFSIFTGFSLQVIEKIIKSRRNSLICTAISVLLLAHSLSLVPAIGFSFLPITDRGEVIVKLEFPTTFSLDNTRERVTLIENSLQTIPGLVHRLTTIGKVDGTVGQTSEGVNLAQIMCKFADKTDRQQSIFALRDLVRKKLESVPDTIVNISVPDQVGAGAEIKMVITGQEFSVLDKLCLNLSSQAKSFSWLTDVDTSVRAGKNELRITPRRAILGDLKIPAIQLGMALRTNIEGSNAGVFKNNSRTYDIRVKLDEKQGLDQISQLELPGMPGHPVILQNFADIYHKQSPILITRAKKTRSTMFYANPTPGMPLGTAAKTMQNILVNRIGLPAGYGMYFLGKVEAMQDGINDFIEVGLVAFILTYLLLAAILNSFTRPLIILTTIPLGMTGCLWALYLSGEPISMMVLLGGVMLIGIVVNNAILIMDRVEQNQEKGSSPVDAMLSAISHEMRAITMITLAAIFGMLPMAVDSGLGSELRSGIGIASIGGIAISTILTMLILPALFALTNRQR